MLTVGSSFIQAASLIAKSKEKQMFALNTCTFHHVSGLSFLPVGFGAVKSYSSCWKAIRRPETGLWDVLDHIYVFKDASIFRVRRNAWPWKMIDEFLWRRLQTELGGRRGGSSERARLSERDGTLFALRRKHETDHSAGRDINYSECIGACWTWDGDALTAGRPCGQFMKWWVIMYSLSRAADPTGC